MQNIVLLNPDGSIYPLQRHYPLTTIVRAQQACDLLGQDVVNVDFESSEHLEMVLGTRINIFGRYYTLNVLPEEQKGNRWLYLYKCTFEGPQYELISSIYFNSDASGLYTNGDFSLTGNLELMIDVLIYNCNRTFGTGIWVRGEVLSTDVKTLTFSNMNCLQALQQTICKEFEVEFEILEDSGVKSIHVGKAGQVLNDVYEYGRGKGLYNLTRKPVAGVNIVTRLYPLGSTENLKPGYRNFSERLRIGDVGFDYIEDPAAIAAFGLVEGIKVFDDVKPHRTGSVSAVSDVSPTLFFDDSMNFDLSERNEAGTVYMINGKSPKIHFNTGDLAGYEFELESYVHDFKAFNLIAFKDPQAIDIPGTAPFTIKPGDEYVILDIQMPEVYVTEAEAELRTKAQLYLDANKAPLINYSLNLDPAFLRDKTDSGAIPNFFGLGDYLQIKDTDLNINKASRIVRFTRNVMDPFEYQVEVADSYQISTIGRLVSEVRQLNNIVRVNDLRNPLVARQNWKSARELVNESFDPDGYLKDGKIRAETLEAAIALFGTEGQQFQLINTVFMPNYLAQMNVIRVTAGQLVHLTVEPGTIKNWFFNAQTVTFSDNAFRYIYAKCRKSDTTASILFSTEKLKTKEDPVYYHFLIGILNSVEEATQTRQLSLSYGFTLISGRWITTGQIKSSDGSTYFDLDAGEIGGNITFRATNGQNKPISEAFENVLALIDGIAEQTDGQVENWFLNGLPTLNNAPAVSWTTLELKNDHVGDNYFDNVSKKSYRFRVDNGVFSWEEVSDDRITQALLLASQAKDTADGKRRVFISSVAIPTPVPPYDKGDLWTNGADLMVCKVQRLTGAYNAADWDEATEYDSTVTAINGGIVTSGTIQVGGDAGSILAGMTGQGTDEDSVRFWAGIGFLNRATAPFQVRQSGEVFARKRIEMMGMVGTSIIGQGGICGAMTQADGPIRFWSGTPYEQRQNAPWSVDKDGNMVAQKGQIGNMVIQNGSLTNRVGDQFVGNAAIILRDDENGAFAAFGTNVLPAIGGIKALARFENTEVDDSIGHQKIAAMFKASGGTGAGARNYSIYASEGIAFFSESISNGQATYTETISSSTVRGVDPSLYDFIAINPTGGIIGLGFLSPSRPIKNGKEITILNENDNYNDFFVVNVLRGVANVRMNGGVMAVFKYCNGYWYMKSSHDNNW